MTTELSTAIKLDIIAQHLNSLEYNKFNIELSMAENNSISVPDEVLAMNLVKQLGDISTKQALLNSMKAELEASQNS